MRKHIPLVERGSMKEYPDLRKQVQEMQEMDKETLDKMYASVSRVDADDTEGAYARILRELESGEHMCLDIVCPKGKDPMEWLRELAAAEKNGTLWDLIERQNEMWKKG